MNYVHKVVMWRGTSEYLVELMKDASASEMEQLVNCYVAVQEKVEYWEKACQADLFD